MEDYIYKIKDIQKNLRHRALTWDILSIYPIETNYIIEVDSPNHKIYKVRNYLKKSIVPLYIHLGIEGVLDDCYIKFRKEDAVKLLKLFI